MKALSAGRSDPAKPEIPGPEEANSGLPGGAIPSAALMVSRGGERVYEGYFGRYLGGDPLDPRSYGQDPELAPATPDTLYDVASLTKPLATAVMVIALIGRGRLSLNTPLGEMLRGLPRSTAKLSIESLLTHTSGLPALPELWRHIEPNRGDYEAGGGLPVDEQMVRARNALYQVEPVAEPGSRIMYSCTGFLLLGEALEAISGQRIDREFGRFCAPPTASRAPAANHGGGSFALGFLPPPEARDRCAATEADPWRRRRIRGEVHDENAYALGGAAGNAGLFGTLPATHSHILRLWGALVGAEAEDALLADGDARASAALHKELPLGAPLLSRPAGSVERRGLGLQCASKEWQEATGLSEDSFGHTGFTGTSFWVDPPRELVIVALTNRLYYGRESSEAGLSSYRRLLHRRAVEAFG